MGYRKTIFPNYISRPRLFMYWEGDEVLFVSIVALSIFIVLFIISVPPWVVLLFELSIVPLSLQAYKKLIKDAPPNWLEHFLYTNGLSSGVSKNFLIRNGFGKDCDIIPPSSIKIFEE